MPTYNANVPQANQKVSATQVPIQTNFASIQDLITQNHEDFNNPLYGRHKWVEMPNQPTTPVPLVNGEMTMYSAQYDNTVTTQSEAFMIRDAAGTPIPFTAAVKNLTGWTFLPSGILMKWTQIVQNFSAGQTLNVAVPFDNNGPDFASVADIYSISVTISSNNTTFNGASVTYYMHTILNTGMQVRVYSEANAQLRLWVSILGVATP